MSLERLYQKYANQPAPRVPGTKWPCGPAPEPPQGQPETRAVMGFGPDGPDGPEPMKEQAVKPLTSSMATTQEVETMLDNLRTVGRDLREVEALARTALLRLNRAAAAELVAVLDDLFETAPSADMARSQCQRVLNDPQALAAARACWPDLASLPDATTPAPTTMAPVVDHAPQWLRLIRENCPLVPEDETHLRRYLSSQAPNAAMRAAQRYVTTWHQAADAEPTPHRKDNAGRRHANQSLRGNHHAG